MSRSERHGGEANRAPLKEPYPAGALQRFPFAGAVDADGHVLEPPDLWENYLEERYRSRALRIRKDDRGAEYLEIDGRPSKLVRNGVPTGTASSGPPTSRTPTTPPSTSAT